MWQSEVASIPLHRLERNFSHIGPLSGEALDLVLSVRYFLTDFLATLSCLWFGSGDPLFLPSGSRNRWKSWRRGSRYPTQFSHSFSG